MDTKPTNAVATAPMNALQLCDNVDKLKALGDLYAQSGFFGAVTASTATAAIINAATMGLSPVEYRAKYHTFEDGTTAIRSDFIQRNFRRMGGRWKFNEWTAEVCDITFTLDDESITGRVTLQEFKDNGVAIGKSGIKANWKRFPKEMLKARCMATYIRALCPEALEGCYTVEEVSDFDDVFDEPRRTPPLAATSDEPEVVEAVDYNVCPVPGKVFGHAWKDMATPILAAILRKADKHPEITEKHAAAIRAIIDARAASETPAAETPSKHKEAANG